MITVNTINDAWKQERTILHVTGIAATTNYVQLTSGTITAKYYGDTSGKLDIDISDLVRMETSTTFSISLREYNAAGTPQGNALTQTITIRGLINPANMIIPYTDAIGWLQNEGFTGAIICPPTTCIANSGGGYSKFEIYPAPVANYNLASIAHSTSIQRSTQISAQGYLRLFYSAGGVQRVFNCTKLQPQLCNRRYCYARWTSRSGVQKQNIFEVRDVADSTASKTEILHINNEYDVRKGQEQTLKLCIDGLTAYDCWYYGDMFTSSKVEVSMDGTNWVQVDVTDNGATIPNSDACEFYNFAATINYKRYDEI